MFADLLAVDRKEIMVECTTNTEMSRTCLAGNGTWMGSVKAFIPGFFFLTLNGVEKVMPNALWIWLRAEGGLQGTKAAQKREWTFRECKRFYRGVSYMILGAGPNFVQQEKNVRQKKENGRLGIDGKSSVLAIKSIINDQNQTITLVQIFIIQFCPSSRWSHFLKGTWKKNVCITGFQEDRRELKLMEEPSPSSRSASERLIRF